MKIAIEEMGYFGDCLLDTAYFKKIKEKYSDSEIDLYYYDDDQYLIFKNSPYIDNFFKWKNGTPSYPEVKKTYDLYLPVIGSLSWSYFTKNEHLFNFRKQYFLNLEASFDDINVHWDKEDIADDNFLKDYNFPVIFSAPGPKPPPLSGKNMSGDVWVQIFKNNPDIDFIQIGSPNTDIMFTGIKNVTSFVGKLSIIESLSLINQSKFVIGCDSLINHGLLLYDKRGIIFFGSTSPKNYGYQKNINIYNQKKCSPCASKMLDMCCMYNGIDNIHANQIQESIVLMKEQI